jgi:ketosteroid isomerase-like protein
MDVIESYFKATDAGDMSLVATLWRPDGTFNSAGDPPRKGIDEVLAWLKEASSAFTEQEHSPVRRISDGSTVAVELRFRGRTWDGRDVAFEAMDVFELDEDGLIASVTLWYDRTAVVQQILGG